MITKKTSSYQRENIFSNNKQNKKKDTLDTFFSIRLRKSKN